MANILLVDDRPENLLALEAMLEPLGQTLLYAPLRRGGAAPAAAPRRRGDPARRADAGAGRLRDGAADQAARAHEAHPDHLRDRDLQGRGARLPRLLGGRGRLRLQAVQPDVLRSKVAVFIELHEKTKQLRQQAELLKEQELADLRRESEERYRFLAEAQPDQIWTAMPNGELDYVNQRVLDYFDTSFSERVAEGWTRRHPSRRPSAHSEGLAAGARDGCLIRERAPASPRSGRTRTAGT